MSEIVRKRHHGSMQDSDKENDMKKQDRERQKKKIFLKDSSNPLGFLKDPSSKGLGNRREIRTRVWTGLALRLPGFEAAMARETKPSIGNGKGIRQSPCY